MGIAFDILRNGSMLIDSSISMTPGRSGTAYPCEAWCL